MRERKSPTATQIGTRRVHHLKKGLSLIQVHAARAGKHAKHNESVAMLTPG